MCFTMYDGRPIRYAVVSWIGSFTGVLSLFAITYAFELIPGLEDLGIITDNWVVGGAGAFGAQSVLVFALPANPASQPWNCVFGSMMSAFIGVSMRKIFVALQQLGCPHGLLDVNISSETEQLNNPIQLTQTNMTESTMCDSDAVRPDLLLIATALANSISIVAMHLTDSVHPPAGAFAYIAINAGAKVRSLGFFYIILPVGIGSLWFVTWSWFVNKYINMMVDIIFCVKKLEGVEKIELNNGVQQKAEETKHSIQTSPGETNEITANQKHVVIEANPPKAERATNSSKLAIRKYPSGKGIGGWIRPLRKKQ